MTKTKRSLAVCRPSRANKKRSIRRHLTLRNQRSQYPYRAVSIITDISRKAETTATFEKSDDLYQKGFDSGFTTGTYAQANGETWLEFSDLAVAARELTSIIIERLDMENGEGFRYLRPLIVSLETVCMKARNLKMSLDKADKKGDHFPGGIA